MILAGDIGGTKTQLGLFAQRESRPVERVVETYPSREWPGLEGIVVSFLEQHPAQIESACFGIAGPVVNGVCRATNLPWVVSEKHMQRRFGWPRVRLLNDLTAMALCIPQLEPGETCALNHALLRKGSTIALMAPGTGLGTALLVWLDGRYIPVSSEGGHVDFAPTDETEVGLWRFLRKRFGRVSIERILSGPGSIAIYEWLKASGQYREPKWLAEQMRTDGAPARVITQAALEKRQPLCLASTERFASVLGMAAGNLALTGLAVGGVFLGGGIPPRILPVLKSGGFMKAFVNKGRFKELLEKVAVRVILHPRAALLGAAAGATQSR